MIATYRVNVGDGETVEMTRRPDEAWTLSDQLPDKNYYGWSEPVLVCQFILGDRCPTRIIASYDFRRGQWRSAMGKIENVTHWQPLPDYPKEYR